MERAFTHGNKRALLLGLGLWAIAGCPSDPDTAADTEADTQADATGEGSTGAPSGGSTDSDASDGVDDATSGGPMVDALAPCDPRDAQPCAAGICAGAGPGGYYCRPPCSSMAEPGDPCGADDVCLSDGTTDQLACFNVDDCDFLDGSPCGAGQACAVLTFDPIRTACVPSPGGEAACGPAGALACDAGLGCLGTDLDGDDAGRCQAWCVPGQPLPADCSACIGLTASLGTCAECSVLAQDCGAGQSCQPLNELLGGVCIDDGPGAPGDGCNPAQGAQGCQAGSLCLESSTDDVFVCVATCDPADPVCANADEACVDLALIVPGADSGVLGLCIAGGTAYCEPGADPNGCAAGDVCLEVDVGIGICGAGCDPTVVGGACEGNFACVPVTADEAINVEPFVEGNGACGVGCSSDAECSGGSCLLLDGVQSDGICGTTCTPPTGTECDAEARCVPTPANPAVGACVVGGDACDDSQIGGCPSPAACVALDGGAAAVCMPLCFAQDPLACGGMPTDCQVRTDASWHAGACLGGGDPCDPLLQDCGADASCDPIGGQAFGGVAFLCDDAGVVAQGGDCSDSDCQAGLICFDDMCRAPCDPGNDDCSVGACADISAALYLPAASLGLCL